MKPLSIAVVGGGLGGPVLAGVLRRHEIASIVYELEASLDARPQGGMLDMHEDSGQRALRELGLHERFRELVYPQGEALRVLDRSGAILVEHPADAKGGGRPEIERSDLRRLLLDVVEPAAIRWASKIARVEPRDGGRHALIFTDGHAVEVDLVVGADGAWSKVRPLVSSAKPSYCGISFIELHVDDLARRHPASAALVGEGMLMAVSRDAGLLGHRHGDRSLGLYAALRVPESWTTSSGVDWSDAPKARAALLDRFRGWGAPLRDLLMNAGDVFIPRRIYALPEDHTWPRTAGVTLLGDAAHLMSPFAGEGANLAMLDGLELGLALVKHGDVEAALAEYEAALFPRSAAAAKESAAGLAMCFADDAPRGLVEFFSGVAR